MKEMFGMAAAVCFGVGAVTTDESKSDAVVVTDVAVPAVIAVDDVVVPSVIAVDDVAVPAAIAVDDLAVPAVIAVDDVAIADVEVPAIVAGGGAFGMTVPSGVATGGDGKGIFRLHKKGGGEGEHEVIVLDGGDGKVELHTDDEGRFHVKRLGSGEYVLDKLPKGRTIRFRAAGDGDDDAKVFRKAIGFGGGAGGKGFAGTPGEDKPTVHKLHRKKGGDGDVLFFEAGDGEGDVLFFHDGDKKKVARKSAPKGFFLRKKGDGDAGHSFWFRAGGDDEEGDGDDGVAVWLHKHDDDHGDHHDHGDHDGAAWFGFGGGKGSAGKHRIKAKNGAVIALDGKDGARWLARLHKHDDDDDGDEQDFTDVRDLIIDLTEDAHDHARDHTLHRHGKHGHGDANSEEILEMLEELRDELRDLRRDVRELKKSLNTSVVYAAR